MLASVRSASWYERAPSPGNPLLPPRSVPQRLQPTGITGTTLRSRRSWAPSNWELATRHSRATPAPRLKLRRPRRSATRSASSSRLAPRRSTRALRRRPMRIANAFKSRAAKALVSTSRCRRHPPVMQCASTSPFSAWRVVLTVLPSLTGRAGARIRINSSRGTMGGAGMPRSAESGSESHRRRRWKPIGSASTCRCAAFPHCCFPVVVPTLPQECSFYEIEVPGLGLTTECLPTTHASETEEIAMMAAGGTVGALACLLRLIFNPSAK